MQPCFLKIEQELLTFHSFLSGCHVSLPSSRNEDGIDIVALGVTDDVNEAELRGISGFDLVTKIDYFDQFHELANLLLEAS